MAPPTRTFYAWRRVFQMWGFFPVLRIAGSMQRSGNAWVSSYVDWSVYLLSHYSMDIQVYCRVYKDLEDREECCGVCSAAPLPGGGSMEEYFRLYIGV